MLNSNDTLLFQILEDILSIVAKLKLVLVNIGHQEGDDIVNRRREDLLVRSGQVAKHEEDASHPHAEVLVLVCRNDGIRIMNRLESGILETGLEHGTKELVKRNELADLFLLGFLCGLVGNLEHGALVTLDFSVNVLELNESIEHLHDQRELIRNEGIVVDELLFVRVALVSSRQLELGGNGVFLILVKLSKSHDCIFILVQDTLLGDLFCIGSLKGDLLLETAHNLAVFVSGLENLMSGKQLGQILLGSTSYPNAAVRGLAETGDNLLQLEQKLLPVADELANLIHEEEEAVVVALVRKVVTNLGAERLRSQSDSIALDVLIDGIIGKIRLYGLGDINQFTERRNREGLGVILPVIPFGLKSLLEGIQLTMLGKRALQILGQSYVELVESSEGIEFLPESFGESRAIASVSIDLRTNVEKDAVNLSILKPDGEIADIGDIDLRFALRVLKRVKFGHGFLQPGESLLLITLVDTEVQVLQEMGLTRAVVTADPDTVMADGFVADGAEK